MLKSTVRAYYYRSFLYGDIISSRFTMLRFQVTFCNPQNSDMDCRIFNVSMRSFCMIMHTGEILSFCPPTPTPTLFIATSNHFEINLLNALSLRFHVLLLGFLNPYMPRDLLALKPLMKKAFQPFRKRCPPPETNGEKHSTTSSLNKRSPSSELHVSRTPK